MGNHPIGGDYKTTYNYDLNGNIKTLTRKGIIDDNKNSGTIDDLTYTYTGNQLLAVNDVNDPQHQNNGFSDNGSFEQQEYNFDANGNLTSDFNKHINEIVYNFQNLPQKIALITKDNNNEINYLYDAAGNKLAKLTTTNHAIVAKTDYIGNFVFENNELKYILTAEGRIAPNREGGYDYQYFLKDQLGSTRVVFDQDGDILQADNYYPFGMRMEGFNGYIIVDDNPNKYLYNGKELQDDFGLDWYDYGARFYDPAIARWTTTDPMAEKYYYESPYCYVGNNPMIYFDPDGRKKFSFNVSGAVTQGVLAIGSEFLGVKWVPFGASEYKLSISLSYDTKSGNLTAGLKGSYIRVKDGAFSLAVGSGGEKKETKKSEVNLEGGVSLKTGKLVGDASLTSDKKFKKEQSGTVGILTGTEREGEEPKYTLGIKQASVEVFFLGANAGLNFTMEESKNQQNKNQQNKNQNKEDKK